ncbi:TetR/AcrR family transcriptional regulator [Acerihabitans sp. TG2]|uniref:TetR/AcrR family transcriptional regulator n=1 Tax=Acerihabitans sp. TG2 TaxID=3096008 RepID=UPI002B2307CD|nr:TetR/AcrR family transcriptional regulator [Acerihabitans sp. TG2]MEA9390248.1 TetR/AcrR family transcriptional regulator [Acerihabitans sp. TG2]
MLSDVETAKKNKINLRKSQIFTATRLCVIKQGFHAASMSQISDLSGLSVGLIYRYFTNKEELINEVVKKIVDKRLKILTSLDVNLIEISDILTTQYAMQKIDNDFITDNILMSEVMAEAGKNPKVAAIYIEADTRMFDALLAKFCKFQPEKDIETVKAQVEVMMTLFCGNDVRSFFKRKANEEKLRDLHDKVLSSLFNTDIAR